MESAFKVGQVVRSKVNAQGMRVGEEFEVVALRVRKTFVGGFTTLVVREARAGLASELRTLEVGNPHLTVEVVS